MNQYLSNSFTGKIVLWGIILTASLIFTSCAPFNREVMKDVNDRITINDIQKNVNQFKGKKVMWGGVIVEMENRPNETRIVIVKTDLDLQKRPVSLDQSEGRFILKQNEFLDPMIYMQGREITAVGEVEGIETLPLGQSRYNYPVVINKQSILWEKYEAYPDYYFYGPLWRWGYQPFGGSYRYRR